MTAANWDAETVLKTSATKLLLTIDADTSDEAVDATSQLLARLLSRSLLGPLADRYGVIELFKERYNRNSEHIREQVDGFVNLIALAIPDHTPDSLDDPDVVEALTAIRQLVHQELDEVVANPGEEVAAALRNDFGHQPTTAASSAAAAGAGGGCLVAMVGLAASAAGFLMMARRGR